MRCRPLATIALLLLGPATAARAAVPACTPRIEAPTGTGALRLRLGGAIVPLPELPAGDPQLRVFPLSADSVLISFATESPAGPGGSAALWQFSCDVPAVTEYLRVTGADFGHAALDATGRTLYFTGSGGVSALDLKRRAVRPVTVAPLLRRCDLNDTPRARDVVRQFLDARTLVIERGGPCGFEAQWESATLHVKNPEKRGATAVRRPHPISALAADTNGGVWMADGDCKDRGSFNLAHYSIDGGKRWRRVVVKTFVEQPIGQVLADATRAGVAVARTMSCGTTAHVDPGWVYMTADGGASWRPIAAPPGVATDNGAPAPEQDPIHSVSSPDGHLDHLVLVGTTGAGAAARDFPRFESIDGGRTWKSITAGPQPGPSGQSVTAKGIELRATADGLLRRGPGDKQAVRVYPIE